MLQTRPGFDAATIASAFILLPATMAQRLVRDRAKIRQAGTPLPVLERDELPDRLKAVLAATYVAFTERWANEARDLGASRLPRVTATPVIAMKCAVARAEAGNAAAGPAALDTLTDEPRLRDCHPYGAAPGGAGSRWALRSARLTSRPGA